MADKPTLSDIPRDRKGRIEASFVPETVEQMIACLADPWWRICSGQLYKIITKENDDDEGVVVAFKPNRAQRRFMERIWYRNIILKARQLGFSTLICIMWLDHALFNPNQRCGIVAQDREAAQVLLRDKVRFAYDNLPEDIRAAVTLTASNQTELLFSNNSSIRVATSYRGGTPHRLHISEYGKICAAWPLKAKEVQTGSIPAVPLRGILVIESTSEGQDGDFYDKCEAAGRLMDAGAKLNPRDYRLHFYPWHEAPEYRLDPRGITLTKKDIEYFDRVERIIGKKLDPEQRAWYVATRNSDFPGNPERMWQEYPSFRAEAFQVSVDGAYYAEQLATARLEGRIKQSLPVLDGVPCYTFWDIGASDGTAVWVMQQVGAELRFIRFFEMWNKPYSEAVKWLQGLGLVFEEHYLPHDADHIRQGATTNESPRDMLQRLMPGQRFHVVDRVQNVHWGIATTRNQFPAYYFDEVHCAKGLAHLDAYKQKWDTSRACWSGIPDKTGGHSEAADAIRQCGQGFDFTHRPRKAHDEPETRYRKTNRRVRAGNRNWRTA